MRLVVIGALNYFPTIANIYPFRSGRGLVGVGGGAQHYDGNLAWQSCCFCWGLLLMLICSNPHPPHVCTYVSMGILLG